MHSLLNIQSIVLWIIVIFYTGFLTYSLNVGQFHLDHFTAWSWIMQTVFYTLFFVFLNAKEVKRVLFHYIFFFIFGTVLLVFVSVFAIWYQAGEIILDKQRNLHNGMYNRGLLVIGDDIVHKLPIIIILFFFVYYARDIGRSLLELKCRLGIVRWLGYLFVVGASPSILFSLWWYLYDFEAVYHVQINEGLAYVLIVLIAFIGNVLAVLFVIGTASKPDENLPIVISKQNTQSKGKTRRIESKRD